MTDIYGDWCAFEISKFVGIFAPPTGDTFRVISINLGDMH